MPDIRATARTARAYRAAYEDTLVALDRAMDEVEVVREALARSRHNEDRLREALQSVLQVRHWVDHATSCFCYRSRLDSPVIPASEPGKCGACDDLREAQQVLREVGQ